MTQPMMVADNSFRQVANLEALPNVRVTHLVQFLKCPRLWAAEAFGEIPRSDNKYLRMGTAAHAVIESFLRTKSELSRAWFVSHIESLIASEMPHKEIDALWEYIQGLDAEGVRSRIVDVEHKWRMEVHPDLKPLTGTVDLITDEGEQVILMTDHKTNRSVEGQDYWTMQAQPLLYALWARRAFPGYRIKFRIGYALLNKKIEWETDPAMDEAMLIRFIQAQEEMRVYSRTGHWLETPGEGCKWCPLKKTCGAFQAQLKAVQDTELESLGGVPNLLGETDVEAYVRLQRTAKLAGELADEVKGKLMEQVSHEVGAQVTGGGHTVTVTVGKRRTAAFSKVGPMVDAMIEAGGDVDVDDLYTVSVTKLDALLQSIGAESLAEKVMVTAIGNPSLKVSQSKVDLGGKAPKKAAKLA